MTTPRIRQAAAFAAQAHAGQTRRGGEVPYVDHVREVAALVSADGQEEDAVIAALLHDTVEDTSTEVGAIKAAFGEAVADIVAELTDPGERSSLPRADRKAAQARHMAEASAAARAIKIADQTSNLRDIVRLPAGFPEADAARAYIDGAAQVVRACGDVSPELTRQFGDARAAALVAISTRMEPAS
ncbi:HD domain-containing protein [Pontivivens insulae]|uniref:Bifunctional (P)ppGpp synthase/hydrolase SpoT n=1 Tax=Pontivivens insulae TaxID=1639689 RepID=A0A2R8ABG2_9RHOB|nr:HD domain-containing protein [Pontivivens insulae]RED13326.1 metal dependent phosphohydrolase [Pontivivens insulae]SPF29418.1 Bifunctional (p)ppGpp synthase/hydrolase SpoT [Pontivivens insulae]